ncbi:MAG: hypothetical protein GY718_07030, partial [Lentisphaerae bacterium]|nr:hypothetical protein [Lentisphaerota bacterium]
MFTTTSINSIPNDGHCLFRSISTARIRNSQDIAVLSERNSIKVFLDSHEEVRGWYYSNNDARRYRDMCLMSGNVVWGSFTDIMVLSHLRNLEIRLVTINNNLIASTINVRGIANPNDFIVPSRYGVTSSNYITIYTNNNGNHFSCFPNDSFFITRQPSPISIPFSNPKPPPQLPQLPQLPPQLPPSIHVNNPNLSMNNATLQPTTYASSMNNQPSLQNMAVAQKPQIKLEPLYPMTPVVKQKSFLLIDLTCDRIGCYAFNNVGLNLDGSLLVEKTPLVYEITNGIKYYLNLPAKPVVDPNLRRSSRLSSIQQTKRLEEYVGKIINIDKNLVNNCCTFQNNENQWKNQSLQHLAQYCSNNNKVWLYTHISPLTIRANKYPRYNGIKKTEVDEYITLLKVTNPRLFSSSTPPLQILIYGGVAQQAEDVALSEKCNNNTEGEPIVGICLFEKFAVLAHVRQNRLFFSNFTSLKRFIQSLMKALSIKYYFLFDDSRNQTSNIELTLLNAIVGKKPFYTSTLGAIPLQVSNVYAPPFVKKRVDIYVNFSTIRCGYLELVNQANKLSLKNYCSCLQNNQSFTNAWKTLWSFFETAGMNNNQSSNVFNNYSFKGFLDLMHAWYKSYSSNPKLCKAILDIQGECLKYFRFSNVTLYSAILSSNSCSEAVKYTIQEHFAENSQNIIGPLLEAIYKAYSPIFMVHLDNGVRTEEILAEAKNTWGGHWAIIPQMQQKSSNQLLISNTSTSNNANPIAKSFGNNSNNMPDTSTSSSITTNSANPYKNIPKVKIDLNKLPPLPTSLTTNTVSSNPYQNIPEMKVDTDNIPPLPSFLNTNTSTGMNRPLTTNMNVDSKKKDTSKAPKKRSRSKNKNNSDFDCSHCNKNFAAQWRLNQHFKSTHGPKIIPCSDCDDMFRTNSQLNKHYKRFHGEDDYQCTDCDKTYRDQDRLSQHFKSTHGPENIQCPHCVKKFRTVSLLNTHVKRIHGPKNHVCPKCGNRFGLKSELNTHLKTTHGTSNLNCHLCPKKFKLTSHLNYHLKTAHAEKGYECSYCSNKFASQSELNQHLRKSHAPKKLICKHCGKKYGDLSQLNQHLKKHYDSSLIFQCK